MLIGNHGRLSNGTSLMTLIGPSCGFWGCSTFWNEICQNSER